MMPMAYPHYVEFDPSRRITPEETVKINEQEVDRIEAFVRKAQDRGLHVSINLHRAPGYCIKAGFYEPFDLWKSLEGQEEYDFAFAGKAAEDRRQYLAAIRGHRNLALASRNAADLRRSDAWLGLKAYRCPPAEPAGTGLRWAHFAGAAHRTALAMIWRTFLSKNTGSVSCPAWK